MKTLVAFISFTLLNIRGIAQEDLIRWDKSVAIKWTDFKARSATNSPFAAMSAIGIHYKYKSWGDGKVYKIRFEIFSTFDKSKSWSKRSLQTRNMLKHEQLHFDLGALVSREFRKEAENKTYSKNYKNEIVDMFNRYSKTLQRLQQKYDDQTDHSNNKQKQREWENLVHQELNK